MSNFLLRGTLQQHLPLPPRTAPALPLLQASAAEARLAVSGQSKLQLKFEKDAVSVLFR